MGSRARGHHRADFAAASYVPAALHDLSLCLRRFCSRPGNAGPRRWHIGLLLVAALCAISMPTIVRDYSKPREDWRAASNAILSVGMRRAMRWSFSRSIRAWCSTIIAIGYSGMSAALHVFAPPYYAGGDDVVPW